MITGVDAEFKAFVKKIIDYHLGIVCLSAGNNGDI